MGDSSIQELKTVAFSVDVYGVVPFISPTSKATRNLETILYDATMAVSSTISFSDHQARTSSKAVVGTCTYNVILSTYLSIVHRNVPYAMCSIPERSHCRPFLTSCSSSSSMPACNANG